MITPAHLLAEFDRVMDATEELFTRVPEDKAGWAPQDGMLTCGQQMLHMAGTLKVYSDVLSGGAWPVSSIDEILRRNHETPSGTAALALRILRRSAAEFRKVVGGMTAADLEVGVYAPAFGHDVPRRTLVLFCIEHHLTHKAELFMYLRLLGVAVGSKELYFGQKR